jgi:hypothetical protein
MSGLVDGARAILADLVRKRLWPIAVALLILMVAVPVLIGLSTSSPPPAAPDGAVAGVAPQPDPAAATSTTVAAERRARVRDPFFDPPASGSSEKAPKAQAAPKGTAAPAKSAAKPPSAQQPSVQPAATTKAKRKASAKTEPSAAPAAARPATGTYYRSAARLGAGATTRPLTRLTPIGNRADPAAVYLGVMQLGRPYAVFVLGHHTTSGGDATCAAATHCRIIGLRPGETQTLTVRTAAGGVARRWLVRVAAVTAVRTSAGTARALRAVVHPHGRSAMRAMSRSVAVAGALGRLGYRRATGLLYSIAAAQALEKATR